MPTIPDPVEAFKAALASGGAAGTGKRAPVFMGQPDLQEKTGNAQSEKALQFGRQPVQAAPKTLTITEAYNQFYTMTDQERAALGISLYKSGLINNPGAFDQVQAAWNKAVDDAAGFYAAGKKSTPWDILALKMGLSGAGGTGGTRTQTSTGTSYNIPSKEDAEAGIKAIFSAAVGRDPTSEELGKYTAMMVGLAKANPKVSSSTTTTDAVGNSRTSSSDSTSQGGITADGMKQAILDKVQADPEYGAYQAATTYYNAAIRAIAAPA